MSNQGQSNSSGAKAFQKSGAVSALDKVVPLGFLAAGAGSAAVAVMTAITPAPHSAIESAARALDRVGFDKGPLLMFGVLMGGVGYSLLKLSKVGSGSGAADVAAEAAEGNASSLEMQGAILGSLQAEIGGLRGEFAESRRLEAEAEANKENGNGEASDPLFRLAASLDQLGAQIDKRVDKARREMLEAVSGIGSRMEVSAEQREKSVAEGLKEIEGTRMDIADLRAQIVRATEGVQAVARTLEEMKADTASAPVAPVAPVAAAAAVAAVAVASSTTEPASDPVQAEAPNAPALPRELDEAAPTASVETPEPVQAEEAATTSGQDSGEPRFAGYSHGDEVSKDTPTENVQEEPKQDLGVSMGSLGFAEPAAPLPKPSEDLGLIDDMNRDMARQDDVTPPLFPDV